MVQGVLEMLSNRLPFVALAVACMAAAAGGGYLATRQNTVPAPVAASVPVPAITTPASGSTTTAPPPAPAKVVQETGAVVAEAPIATVPAPKATAAKPATPPARVNPPRDSHTATAKIARQEQGPAIPSSAAAQAPAPPAPVIVESAPPSPRPEEHVAPEPVRQIEPPARTFAEYVVSADSVIGLQTESRVSSETARVEDRVEARVTRDVKVGDHVAIPAGSRAIGSVMQVERGGKFKEKARLGIRFHTLVLADGTRIPISTETIYREGEGPGTATSQKVGGAAVGGAILGAILGGGKGMAIGAAAGAGAGSAAVAAGDRNAATLPAGTSMTVRILQPITVTSERD
jgi:type IV secretory pathway VirB10-like protein